MNLEALHEMALDEDACALGIEDRGIVVVGGAALILKKPSPAQPKVSTSLSTKSYCKKFYWRMISTPKQRYLNTACLITARTAWNPSIFRRSV